MAKYTYLENIEYEMLQCENGDCYIKDKKMGKYFFKRSFSFPDNMKFDQVKEVSINIVDKIYILLSTISVIIFFYLLFKLNVIFGGNIQNTWRQNMEIICFLILNIFLHEAAHLLTMKIYGRKVNKIGFKLNFIFPAFYVNTSDSYILPRMRKFFVYYSGIMVNIFSIFLIIVFLPHYIYWTRMVFLAVMVSLLPIGAIKTDGYHIIFNIIFKANDFKNSKNIKFLITKYVFILVVICITILTFIK